MQLTFFDIEKSAFEGFIQRHFSVPVSVHVTDNRISMISVQEKRSGIMVLRIHWMFLQASRKVLDALIYFIKGPRKVHKEIIRDYINSFPVENRNKKVRKLVLRPKGAVFNVKELFDEVNHEYFFGLITSQITFGRRMQKRRRVRFLQLGYYSGNEDVIIINARLDKKTVPRIFIKFIVYHEMLHAEDKAQKGERKKGRIHTRLFKKREEAFKEYEQVKKIFSAVVQKL